MPRIHFFLLLFLVSLSGFGRSYMFIHRSNSTFESELSLELKVNYLDIAALDAGDWIMVIFEEPKANFVVNIGYPADAIDDSEEPCVFRRKLMNATADSVMFLSIGDEFCGMRETPYQRTKLFLSNNTPNIRGYTVANNQVTAIPKNLVTSITKDVVGVDANNGRDIGNINIDSLKLLALEALELRRKLEEKERAMESQLQEYFELMKAINQLDQNVEPVVHMGMEEGGVKANGEMSYNIRATFSYDLISDQGVKAELIHYPPGAYQLEKSAAASATAFSMKKSIENYLIEYFEQGSTVKIRIIGSADASPIYSPIVYAGEYDFIDNHNYRMIDDYQLIITENPEIDSFRVENSKGRDLMDEIASKPEPIEQGESKSISLNSKQGFKENEELAYLRSLGIKDYMMSNVAVLGKTKNEFLHQVKLEQGVGGIYRKVVMELLIEDVIRGK